MKSMLLVTAIVAAVFLLFFYGVGEESSEALPAAFTAPQHATGLPAVCSGPVLETMSSGGYTYVRIDCGDREQWAAGPETEVAVGDEVALAPGQEMRDFHSPTLDRTFESILFVPSVEPGTGDATGAPSLAAVHQQSASAAAPVEVDLSGVEKPAEVKSIAEIFANRAELEGVEVTILGKVVKYNAMILGKNWIHLQDGTGEPGSNDLTITTQHSAGVGDTVLVRGTVGLDKDIGAGYQYEVLLENATVTVQ